MIQILAALWFGLLVVLSYTAAQAEDAPATAPAPEKPAAAAPAPEKPAVAAPAPAPAKKDYMILRIGADEIKKSDVDKIWNGLFPGGTAPDFDSFEEKVRQNVLRGIVSEHLLYKEAMASGIEGSQEFKDKLEKIKKKLIIQTFLDKKGDKGATEDKLKEAYEKLVKELAGKEEVRARHILLATEKEAEKIEDRLKSGEDFSAVAKEASQDKASAVSGGDLGYFSEDRMVPEFSKAAFKLKAGEVSDPVKTDFGWHIIKVEDRRKTEVPPFADVKEQLKEQVKSDALKDYINQLIDTADVKYYGSDGGKRELTKAPDTAKE